MHLKLTDVAIQNLKPASPQLDIWDTLLPSFGVRIGIKRKTFIVMHGKPRKRTALGHWPTTTLADARNAARLIIAGPYAQQSALRQSDAKEVLQHYLRTIQLRPRTLYEYERLLTKYLPDKILAAITPQDILRITDDLLDRPTECRHTHVAMQTFFNWCVPRYLPQSPMQGLKTPTKPRQRDRVLSPEELRSVYHYGDALSRLCILTLMRRSEVAAIQPSWLQADVLVIPEEVSKNRREHRLPITLPIRKFLAECPLPRRNWARYKDDLDQRSGVHNWVLHDLRRTGASMMGEIDVDPHIIERILNHVTGSGTALQHVYNRHNYERRMRSALQAYHSHLATLLGPL